MSGAFLPPVVVKLIADAREFNATTTSAINGVQRIGAAGDTAGKKLGYLGQKIATGIIAGGVAVGVASVKMAGDFESSMTKLVTGAGEAQSNIKMIHDGILSLGGTVGQTPKQLADGMYFIGSAGYHGAEGLKVLQAAAQGAAVGGADLITVADAVTTVMTNYGLSADQAAGATSGLVRSVSLGKTTLGEMSGALAKVLPLGAAVGISFGEMTGALATMTASGIKADMASEQLRAMISGLIAPSEEAKKVLQMIGMTSQTVADNLKNPKVGLAGTLDMIGTKLAKVLPGQTALQTEAFEKLTGGITGTGARLLLTGSHFKTFKDNIQSVTDATKNASGEVIGFDKAQQTLNFKLQALKSTGQGILINLGEALLPTAKALADWAMGAIAFFKKHPLISEIASDAAIGLFALSVAAKLKKGFQALAGLFNFGKLAAQIAAMRLNTTALIQNTAALLGKNASDLIPNSKKGLIGARLLGGGVGAAGLAAGAFAGAGALGLAYAAQHPIQKLPPEFMGTGGRGRPDLQYAKLTKAYQAFHAAGGTDANWTKQKNAFIASGHTNAEWLAGGASITMPKAKPKTPPVVIPSRSNIPTTPKPKTTPVVIAPPTTPKPKTPPVVITPPTTSTAPVVLPSRSRVPNFTPTAPTTTPARTGLPSRSGGGTKVVTVKIQ